MDKIDRKLLRLLQENARYSLKQLSEKVFLSSPAVSARMEKLENDGIITGYHADVNLDRMGYHITAYINIEMNIKLKNELVEFITDIENVIECHVVSGSTTLMMKVCFPSTAELDVFIGQLQHYGNTETQIIFSSPIPYRGVLIKAEELTGPKRKSHNTETAALPEA